MYVLGFSMDLNLNVEIERNNPINYTEVAMS